MSDEIPVFVDAHPITVPRGATVQDAVRVLDPALADLLDAGRAYVTDGTGRVVDAHMMLEPGGIVRVIRSAPRTGGEAPEP